MHTLPRGEQAAGSVGAGEEGGKEEVYRGFSRFL
jgi:hypothetical protein